MTQENRWFFSIDRGGTFTDVIGFAPTGTVHTQKLLSRSTHYDDAAIEGIRSLLGLENGEPIPAERVSEIRMGTTVATNALLERQGAPTALAITNGFGDLLEIGDQARPRLFDLAVTKPENLYSAVVEIDERISADGKVIEQLDAESAREALQQIYNTGLRSIAIALLHAWIEPQHEKRLGAIARKIGFTQISLSHQLLNRIKLVGRGRTTLVDAYLSPLLRAYVDRVEKEVGAIPLSFMQSSGGLTAASGFCGKEAILSGPAGGVVAVAALADQTGTSEVIGFDMGGTSTDVSRYGGVFERNFENETAGVKLSATMLAIETVAAGGGSILFFDGLRMRVGPDSAGANPGPCCYGRGGPLTITDANLLLGRIRAENFPHHCGPGEDSPLFVDATRKAFAQRTTKINRALQLTMTPEEVAHGYIRIANEIMAQPIKRLSIAKGYDVRRHALCSFGGAGGLHACAIARSLGMRSVVVDRLSPLYSAYGIALADQLKMAERSVIRRFSREEYDSLDPVVAELGSEIRNAFRAEGRDPDQGEMLLSLDIRPQGADSFLTIRDEGYEAVREAYETTFQDIYGFAPDRDRLEILNVRLECAIKRSVSGPLRLPTGNSAAPPTTVTIHFSGGAQEIPSLPLDSLAPGSDIPSPALLVDEHTAILVEPGFTGSVDEAGRVRLELAGGLFTPGDEPSSGQCALRFDPVTLELFASRFMSVAEQMGETLRNTAHSVNIKERLDFSCALFDGEGRLVANAPHVPVHLGAMGESIKGLIAARKLRPGQTYVCNHPAKGGSHLPDITVMTPLFMGQSEKPDFFVANRGHHADIGGLSPGSLSPFCERLIDEGVILDNLLLVDGGAFREKEMRAALASGPHPARNIDERISDLTAQLAANHKGEMELRRLVEREGIDRVVAYMGHLRDAATEAVRLALGELLDGRERLESSCEDSLDDGSIIAVAITIEGGASPTMTVDFSGTADESPVSLNAPVAVVRAAVLYVVRTLVTRDLPLNDGCMTPVTLLLPERSILNPSPGRAVAGGNVETSQRIVDVLYGALGVAAASQGTMNNVTFGFVDGRGFYETIAGGSGAIRGGPGASGVQVHMTNTRITDPEVLEQRLPGLRLKSFSLRPESGGAGEWHGGNGVIREYEVREPCDVTLFGERRVTEPYGAQGGQPGARGVDTLLRDGVEQPLRGHESLRLQPGDILRIETPGGGGFGEGV